MTLGYCGSSGRRLQQGPELGQLIDRKAGLDKWRKEGKTPDLRFIRLALEAAQRLEQEAKLAVLKQVDIIKKSASAEEFSSVTEHQQQYATKQTQILERRRESKWRRDSLPEGIATHKRRRGPQQNNPCCQKV